MSNTPKLRVGLFGIGLAAYWPAFEGLEARLTSYLQVVAGRLAGTNREIIHFGMIDGSERSAEMAHRVRREDIDLLVIYVTTYALSATVLPIVRRAKAFSQQV